MTLTHDDLTELEAVTDALADAEQKARDLADRCRRKGDLTRGASIEVKVAWQCEHARQTLEGLFA